MANQKISQLPYTSVPSTGDLIPIVHTGQTQTTTIYDVLALYGAIPTLSRQVFGGTNISGDLTVTGNLIVSGNTSLGKDANSTTTIYGQSSHVGNFFVSGSGIITGNLRVSGNTFFGTNSNSSTSVSGLLYVDGSGRFRAIVLADSGIISSGAFVHYGNSSFGFSSSANHMLSGITFFDTLWVLGNITCTGNLFVDNDTASFVDLRVQTFSGSDSTFGSGPINRTTINSQLIAKSQTFFEDDVRINKNAVVSGNLSVSGNATLGTGNSLVTVNNKVEFRTQAYFLKDISVSGITVVSGNLVGKSGANFQQNVTVAQNLRVSGTGTFGTTTSDQHYFNGDLRIANSLTVSGNLNISGQITSLGSKYARFTGLFINNPGYFSTDGFTTANFQAFPPNADFSGLAVGQTVFITGNQAPSIFYGNFTVTSIYFPTNFFTYTLPRVPSVGETNADAQVYLAYESGKTKDIAAINWKGSGRYEVVFRTNYPDNNYMATLMHSEKTGSTKTEQIFVSSTGYRSGSCEIVIENSGQAGVVTFKSERII